MNINKILLERILFEEYVPEKVGDLEYDDVYYFTKSAGLLVKTWIKDADSATDSINDIYSDGYPADIIKDTADRFIELAYNITQQPPRKNPTLQLLIDLLQTTEFVYYDLKSAIESIGPKHFELIQALSKQLFYVFMPLFKIINSDKNSFDKRITATITRITALFNNIMQKSPHEKQKSFQNIFKLKEKYLSKIFRHIRQYIESLSKADIFYNTNNKILIDALLELILGFNAMINKSTQEKEFFIFIPTTVKNFLNKIKDEQIPTSKTFIKKLIDLTRESLNNSAFGAEYVR